MTIDFKNYPLSVLRGYKPPMIRFSWYAVTDEDTAHCGLTLGGLTNIIGKQGKTIKTLQVSDYSRGKVYLINNIGKFIKLWGENYLDPEWKIPQSVRE